MNTSVYWPATRARISASICCLVSECLDQQIGSQLPIQKPT